MRILLSFILTLYLSTQFSTAHANVLPVDSTGPVYDKDSVDTQPAFKGGDAAIGKFLGKNIHYPRYAQENSIMGTVPVAFVVDETGKVINVHIDGERQDTSLEREAMRVISLMPDWKPGIRKGEKVAVKVKMPIRFTIQEDGPRKRHALLNRKDTAIQLPHFVTTSDTAPVFPGGEYAIVKFIKKNMHYPSEAIESGIEGTVTVRFTISEGGEIKDAATVGPKVGGHLEFEALRVIKAMPKWQPGTTAGKPVAVVCDYPMLFSLRELYEKRKRERLYPMY